MQNILYFVLVNLLITGLGYFFIRKQMLWESWILVIAGLFFIHYSFLNEMPTMRMLVIITTAFTGMKVITTTMTYQHKPCGLTFAEWFFFVFTWAGMRGEIFEKQNKKTRSGANQFILFGLKRLAVGLVLIFAAHFVADLRMGPTLPYYLITTMLLMACSLILHFGLLNISTGFWRYCGVDAYALFNEPWKAKTLNEFWSKRWNIAFSEMTSIAVFRPLRARFGSSAALLTAFMFSGILHELAISVPVQEGYGLPMLYFVLQGLGVLLEKIGIQKKPIWFKNTVITRIWLLFWLIIPLPLLFHKSFATKIIWYLAGLCC